MYPLKSNQMFLDEAVSVLVAQIRKAHAEHFAFAERLNEFANRQLFATSVRTHERQSVLIAALLPRLLTAFQATVIMAERGMLSEVRLLVRKVSAYAILSESVHANVA